MGNFDRGGRSGGGRSFGGGSRSGGGRSFGGGRDFGQRGDREMHHAVCSNCGKDCEVPFKPTGSKPVLCSDCFAKNRDSEPRRFSDRGGDRAPRRDFAPREGGAPQNSKQLDMISAKLDQVLALLNGAPKGKAPKVEKVMKVEKVVKAVKAPKADVDGLDVSDILESSEAPEIDPNNSTDSVKEE